MRNPTKAQADANLNTVIITYLLDNLIGRSLSYSTSVKGEYYLAFIYKNFNSYLHDCIDVIINFDRDNSENLTIDRLQAVLASASQDDIGCKSIIFYFPELKISINSSKNELN